MFKKNKFILSFLSAITVFSILTLNVNAATISNRIYGTDRIKTSVAIANSGWTSAKYAVIAYAWDFPDAVSAAPLAYKYDAPILLTDQENLSADTSSELTNLGVTQVFLVGGTGVISTNVENQIKAKGITVARLYGDTRYQTSIAIANQIGVSGSIVITNGYDPYEAMSISPIAAKLGMPIILTSGNDVPDEVKNYIQQNNITKTYILGKADGVTDEDGVADSPIFPNPVRITATDQYDGNVNIIKMFNSDFNFSKIYLASGESWADALAGSALAATTLSPIIFVDSNIPQETQDLISSEANTVTNICVLGGTGAISDATVQDAETLLSGGTLPDTTSDESNIITGATFTPNSEFNTGELTINVAPGTVIPTTGALIVNGTTVDGYTVNNNTIETLLNGITAPTSASITINGTTYTTNTITTSSDSNATSDESNIITSATFTPNSELNVGILTINVASGTVVPETGAVMINGAPVNSYTVNSNTIEILTSGITVPTSASVIINGTTYTTNTITTPSDSNIITSATFTPNSESNTGILTITVAPGTVVPETGAVMINDNAVNSYIVNSNTIEILTSGITAPTSASVTINGVPYITNTITTSNTSLNTSNIITSATFIPNSQLNNGILTINVASGTVVPETGAVMVNGVASGSYTVNGDIVTVVTGNSTMPTSASIIINGVTYTTNTITNQ